MNEIVKITFTVLLSLLLSLSFSLYAAEEETASEDENKVVQEKADVEELAVPKEATEAEKPKSEESTEAKEVTDTEESESEESTEAEEVTDTEESESEESTEAEAVEPEALESLTIKHQVGDTDLPVKTITADPMVLLQTLKEDILAQTEKQTKPFTMKTEVIGVWREQFADSWGKLPPLTVITEIDKEGKGKSDITLPAFKKVLPDPEGEEENATIDWKGLQGQLTFAEKFADLKADLTIQGLTIKQEEGEDFSFDMEKTTLKGEFDADLMPTSLEFKLPSLKAVDHDMQTSVQGVTLKGKVKSLEQGLELSAGEFKIKELQFSEDDTTSTFKDFELTSDGSLEKEGLTYKISTKIGNLNMPKEAFDDLMDLDLSYVGDLELRRLDTDVVKQLQKTARDLQKKRQSGEIPADMVSLTWVAKLTELAPALLKKSPEIALSQLKLKTDDGKLDGKVTVGIEGNKVSNLEDFSNVMGALQVQADFSITKVLLEKTMTTVMANQMTEDLSEEEALKEAQKFTEKQIKGYIEQKFLKEAGNNYELTASFKEGKLMVNGQEMPLPF
jgi:uncharacterized protein YdgA (DUF945 family)